MKGVNNVHLGWLPEVEQKKAISDMVSSGVKNVRIALVAPTDASISAVQLARKSQLAVNLVIRLSGPHLVGKNVTLRPGNGRLDRVVPLSAIDIMYFRQALQKVMQELDRRQLRLLSLEIGNEVNWAGFNGDLEAYEPGTRSPVDARVTSLAAPGRYVEGLRRYLEAVRIVRELRDASKLNQDVPILLAGLASMPLHFAAAIGGEYVDPHETIQILQEMGLDSAVDGYALHYYPGLNSSPAEKAQDFEELMQVCGTPPDRIPCWLTEWGFALENQNCPADDSVRSTAVRQVKSMIAGQMAAGRVIGAYYFDWNGRKSSYALWRCNGLTESGRILLQD